MTDQDNKETDAEFVKWLRAQHYHHISCDGGPEHCQQCSAYEHDLLYFVTSLIHLAEKSERRREMLAKAVSFCLQEGGYCPDPNCSPESFPEEKTLHSRECCIEALIKKDMA